MFFINIASVEFYDELTERFIPPVNESLMLEHSLVSLSKWESFYEKPFLGSGAHTHEEDLKYIEFMTISPVSSLKVYDKLSQEDLNQITGYIDAKMTATTFKELPSRQGVNNSGEFVTAEIIYYWLVALNIPFETQYWHFNRLLALVRVLNQKNAPGKKMNRRDSAAERSALNASRRAQMKSTG